MAVKALLVSRILERDEKINRLLLVLDQIAKLTKTGIASRSARAAAEFERSLPDAYMWSKK